MPCDHARAGAITGPWGLTRPHTSKCLQPSTWSWVAIYTFPCPDDSTQTRGPGQTERRQAGVVSTPCRLNGPVEDVSVAEGRPASSVERGTQTAVSVWRREGPRATVLQRRCQARSGSILPAASWGLLAVGACPPQDGDQTFLSRAAVHLPGSPCSLALSLETLPVYGPASSADVSRGRGCAGKRRRSLPADTPGSQ